MNYVFARIVGNELPPRDSDNSKHRSVVHILKNEIPDGFDRIWVLNRINDPSYRQLLLDTLSGEQVLEMPFSLRDYFKCSSVDERILYATNVNMARNFALDHCRSRYRFTVSLDQDCYYWPEEWAKVQQIIEADQKVNDRKYYISPSKRVHGAAMPATLEDIPEEEPMIIFRNDADKFFDPNCHYGEANKIELLNRIGVRVQCGKHFCLSQTSDEAMRAGHVCHIAYSDPQSEVDCYRRHDMRKKGIKMLIAQLDAMMPKIM